MRDIAAELGLEARTLPEPAEIENATAYLVNARRNLMTGLWAGHVLGYRGPKLSRYALAVMNADYAEPGPRDVVRRIHDDLRREGIKVSEADIERRVIANQRTAWRMFAATD